MELNKMLCRGAFLLAALVVAAPASAAVREYCIAADEVLWDYAPSYPTNLMTGQPFTPEQEVFVGGNMDTLIGHVYRKALYRQYALNGDGCDWGTLIEGAGADTRAPGAPLEHLGSLGPVIRGAVGDTIMVHFRNNTGAQTLSVHPHGVFYNKDSEGAPYADGTSGADKADDAVPPGGMHTYVWPVPRRAGPGPMDPSSIAWPYHSHVDEPADTNAGLIGVIVIARGASANSDGSPRNVDREFVSLFTVFDENASLFLDQNVADYAPNAPMGDSEALEEFEESNLMHGINGLVYGNNTGYVMKQGERVRWYILGMGTEVDLHSPHWHGATLLHNGNRLDVTEVLPAATKTLDLEADNPGTWMFHCHVNDHITAGMTTKFTIEP